MIGIPAGRVTPEQVAAWQGWVVGPQFYLEISGAGVPAPWAGALHQVAGLISPDVTLPDIRYRFFDGPGHRLAASDDPSLLIPVSTAEELAFVLANSKKGIIYLRGHEEERPGLKDFSSLASLLEVLELTED